MRTKSSERTDIASAHRWYLRQLALLRAVRGPDALPCCLSNRKDERTGEPLHTRTCRAASA